MPKILKAIGEHGKFGKDWNWCEKEEVVGDHGSVCANACSCGCAISFVGIRSARACTQAVVVEVSDKQFRSIKEVLHSTTLKGWSDDQDIADEAVRLLNQLSISLTTIPAGHIARLAGGDLTFTNS